MDFASVAPMITSVFGTNRAEQPSQRALPPPQGEFKDIKEAPKDHQNH
jgi:hypothetical protein